MTRPKEPLDGKRKVTKTSKAKAADAGKGDKPEKKPPGQPARARAKGGKGKKAAVPASDEESSSAEEDEGIKIDWSDLNLTWELVAAISDNDTIKQGLFPGRGANVSTAKGGGKKKIDHHYDLAKALFADHEKYGEAFRLAHDSKQKNAWARKIKNRIGSLVSKTRKYSKEMGETGAGITSEDQINMNVNNEFTNKWAMIQGSFPWLWKIKELIAEWPNVVPVGLGNNNSEIDMSDYLPAFGDDLELEQSEEGLEIDENEEGLDREGGEVKEDDDDDPVPAAQGQKRKADADEKKTGAQPGISAPSVPGGANTAKKSCNMMDRFTDAVKAEETTTQKQLDVKHARLDLQKTTVIARIQAQAKIKISQNQIKAETRLERLHLDGEKMRMEHEFRMAQLNTNQGIGNQHGITVDPLTPVLTQLPSSFSDRSSHDNLSTPNSASSSYGGGGSFNLSDFRFDTLEAGGLGLQALLDADVEQEGNAGASGSGT